MTGPPGSVPGFADEESRIGWGPLQVLLGIVAFFVLLLLEVGIVAAVAPRESLGSRLALQGLTGLTLLAVAFAIAGRGELASGATQLGLRRSRRSPWVPAILAFASYLASAIAISELLSPEQRNLAEDLGFGQGVAGNLAAGLLIVVVAPVAEELFFRGFVYGGLRRALPVAPALVLAGLVFGAFHLGPGDSAVALQLAIFGAILCALYEYTGSLWPCVSLHLVNNAIAFSFLTG